MFEKNLPEIDEAFVDGMKALKDVGCRVVVCADEVEFTGSPRISDRIGAVADGIGFSEAGIVLDEIRYVMLAVQGSDGEWYPSLPLETFVKWKHPEANLDIELVPQRGRVLLLYRGKDSGKVIEQEYVDLPCAIAESPNREGREWTKVARVPMRVVIPSNRVLSAHTVSYLTVMKMDKGELASLFRDKIVIVGDMRREVGVSARTGETDVSAGSRERYFTYAVATNLSNLLRGVNVSYGVGGDGLLRLAGAMAGILVGWCVLGPRVGSTKRSVLVGVGIVSVVAVAFVMSAVTYFVAPLRGEVWFVSGGIMAYVIALGASFAIGSWNNPGLREFHI